jgi:hypothetical protein
MYNIHKKTKVALSMKHFLKPLTMVGVAALLLLPTSCGSQSSETLQNVAQSLNRQSSVCCTLTYTLTMDAQIDEVAYEDLTQTFTAEIQTDLQSGACYATGNVSTTLDDQELQHYDIEAYTDTNNSYYRYNDYYYNVSGTNTLLTYVEMPESMADNGSFQRQEATELVDGAECYIYSGTALTNDSSQTLYSFLSSQPISLSDCPITATLSVYQETNLPATLSVEYTDLESLNIQVEDENGNSYQLKTLQYDLTYQNYGTEVNTDAPEEFKSAAQSGLPDASEVADRVDSGSAEDTYRVYNDLKTYYFEIATPEYMRRDDSTDEALTFYYNYSDSDTETITYRITDDYTSDEEEQYTDLLLSAYRDADTLSSVSAGDVKTVTIGTYKVYYRTFNMAVADDTGTYKVMQVYSWTAADTDGKDSLEIEIAEYSTETSPTFVDVKTELETAYSTIQGIFYSEN